MEGAASPADKIKAFAWKVLEALCTTIGLCAIALAHWVLNKTLAYCLSDGWTKYHALIEGVTTVVFYASYFFLLIEIAELFWPSWLKRKPPVQVAVPAQQSVQPEVSQ